MKKADGSDNRYKHPVDLSFSCGFTFSPIHTIVIILLIHSLIYNISLFKTGLVMGFKSLLADRTSNIHQNHISAECWKPREMMLMFLWQDGGTVWGSSVQALESEKLGSDLGPAV